MSLVQYPELGFYALPGHVSQPAELAGQVRQGEALGLGSVWIAERLNSKNVPVLAGIAAGVSSRLGIASGLLANLPLRHPLVTASFGATMALVTGGRFALGIGRGVDHLADSTGTPRLNMRLMKDFVDILRALWRGESVDYEGPLGTLKGLTLGVQPDAPPPVIMAAMGDKTCKWAGSFCDGVVLNALWSPEAVARSVELIRQGAREAGRDPASVRIWAILVTACEVDEDYMLDVIVRRLNTYVLVPPVFAAMCVGNGWDQNVAAGMRDLLVEADAGKKRGLMGGDHTSCDRDHLRRCLDAYPQRWLDEGAAVGSAARCASKILERFDAGVDGVLLHGSTPEYLASLVTEWGKVRPARRFAARSANPG
mgnify:CR=1 FL=1